MKKNFCLSHLYLFLEPLRVFAIFCLILIASCGSADFGNEPADYVVVNTKSPTWERDIAPIMKLKCLNCHGENRSSFVPSDTPPYANNKFDQSDFFQTKAASIEARIFKDAKMPMPPQFATPLTADERAALVSYFKILSSAATKDLPTGTPAPDALGFEKVKSLFSTSCAVAGGCHAASGGISDLTTYEKIFAKGTAIKGYLERKEMPKANTKGYKPTADENKLMIQWITEGMAK